MKVKPISRKGDTVRFIIEETTPGFANALRRIILTEVPVLAIERVNFTENNSPMFDEVLAHRLGSIPLSFDPSKFNFRDDCTCKGKGCPLCEVGFAAELTGPGTLYSRDLKSTNKNVRPTSPDFPIIKLLKGHKVKLEAYAVLGKGKDHAKWQAASAAYNFLPSLSSQGVKNPKKVADACPQEVLTVKGEKVMLRDPYSCDSCRVCEDVSDGKVKVTCDESAIVFRVETVSGLDPRDIVLTATKILQEKAADFRKELKAMK